MKKIFAGLLFISLMCGFAFAQSSFPEIDIVREIKLLKSTRSDVRAIMSEFDSDEEVADEFEDEEDEGELSNFRSDNAEVRVYYSAGGCSEDPDDGDAPEWDTHGRKAVKVVIVFDDTVKLSDLGLNLSGFKKRFQREDMASKEDSIWAKSYIYHDEKNGILITVDDDEIEKIVFHPPFSRLCKNEANAEILSGKTSFVDATLRSASISRCYNIPSNVTKLVLLGIGDFGCKDEKCLDPKKEILVRTTAVDMENDTLVYNYTVSGGKINGSGPVVTWDLMGVEPGRYSITAGSDDGCGVCGETKTQEIIVKENSYEIVPQPSAQIKELILDKTELVAACPVGRLQRVRCASGNCGISVTSTSADGENLIYKYKTDGGEVIGSGDKVIWDLTNLKPDEYRIEVSASKDGTVFGEPKTAKVIIKENPNCTLPKK